MSREALITAARRMQSLGLNRGTSGNLSLRHEDGILITPSAIPYDDLTPEMIPLLRKDGAHDGAYRPSSEWRFHLDIYAARPEVGAVVHNHAPHATALAMAHREIPACHYMIARFGGAPIRVAPYAVFGTAELSRHAVAALQNRTACLLANHGCITLGATIDDALAAAMELETLAQQYLLSLAAGGSFVLSDAQVQEAVEQFAAVYGPNLPRTKSLPKAAAAPVHDEAPAQESVPPAIISADTESPSAVPEPARAVIIGHRGARGEAPENTIAGFRHAQSLGAAGIETDIAVTADFIPVLHHNPDLADGRLIRDLKFSELDGIPMLAEALIAVPTIDWLLEIKTFPPEQYKTHSPAVMVLAVRAALAAAGAPVSRISILAFDWSVLAEVRRQDPALTCIALTAPPQLSMRELWWGAGFEKLTAPQAVARTGAAAWSPQHHSLTADAIAEAKSLGLRIIPWTVNDPAAYARLAPLVDAITTDFPSRFLPPPKAG